MIGRVWSWLLEFAPVQEAVRREVATAVNLVMDDTEEAQSRQRKRHRDNLDRAEQELVELRARLAELMAANADLLSTNAALKNEVAELSEAAEREVTEREQFAQRVLQEQEGAAERQWQGATTDVFCCQSCWAFWFLSTSPDRATSTVRGPYGRHDPACGVCSEPLVALPAAKSVVLRKGAEDRICRPVIDDDPRSDIAIANAELAAVAEGLGRLPKVPSRTAAWIATDLTGLPDLPATVVGDIAGRTTMPVPLDGIVAGIRAFIEVGAPKKVTAPGS